MLLKNNLALFYSIYISVFSLIDFLRYFFFNALIFVNTSEQKWTCVKIKKKTKSEKKWYSVRSKKETNNTLVYLICARKLT